MAKGKRRDTGIMNKDIDSPQQSMKAFFFNIKLTIEDIEKPLDKEIKHIIIKLFKSSKKQLQQFKEFEKCSTEQIAGLKCNQTKV